MGVVPSDYNWRTSSDSMLGVFWVESKRSSLNTMHCLGAIFKFSGCGGTALLAHMLRVSPNSAEGRALGLMQCWHVMAEYRSGARGIAC